MAKRDPDTVQLKFENGTLVERSTESEPLSGEHTVDPIEPGDQTGFIVEVKAGAIDVNSMLPKIIETHGRT
jgi:hypothetical protein